MLSKNQSAGRMIKGFQNTRNLLADHVLLKGNRDGSTGDLQQINQLTQKALHRLDRSLYIVLAQSSPRPHGVPQGYYRDRNNAGLVSGLRVSR